MNHRVFDELEQFAQELPCIVNNYIFTQMIGSGGFSRVFLVKSIKYNKIFVAKVIPLNFMGDGCHSDLDFLCGYSHPALISVYDSFELENNLFLVLDYCPHGTIKKFFKESRNSSDPFLIDYFLMIAKGFAQLHSRNIAHRDIKPSNILIDANRKPKIIDFGIAATCEPGTLIEHYSGSYYYSAPEVINREPHDPFKADVWSLGVTLYVLAVGQLPWPRSQQKVAERMILQGQFSLPASLNPHIAALIKRMIVVEPELRPSMQELVGSCNFRDSALRRNSSTSSQGKYHHNALQTLKKRHYIPILVAKPVSIVSDEYLN